MCTSTPLCSIHSTLSSIHLPQPPPTNLPRENTTQRGRLSSHKQYEQIDLDCRFHCTLALPHAYWTCRPIDARVEAPIVLASNPEIGISLPGITTWPGQLSSSRGGTASLFKHSKVCWELLTRYMSSPEQDGSLSPSGLSSKGRKRAATVLCTQQSREKWESMVSELQREVCPAVRKAMFCSRAAGLVMFAVLSLQECVLAHKCLRI